MSDKPLLLSGAKSGVIVRPHTDWLRLTSLAIGFFVIFVGAVDVMTRVSKFIPSSVGFIAFAPAITIVDPSVLSHVRSATTTPLIPARLKVLSLGIDADVVRVGKKADGSMDAPKKFDEIGWYELGSKVGAPGNAVFAGHVNNALTQAGVFAHLSQIKQGDKIDVIDAEGRVEVYAVSSVALYPKDEAPLESIFTTTGASGVVLITCDGAWDGDERSFTDRLVVFAKPAL